MNRSLPISLLTCFLLGGCSFLQGLRQPPKLTGDPLKQAEQLEREGRMGEAVTLLQIAVKQGLNDQNYQEKLLKTRKLQERYELELQDQLLIEQVVSLQQQLPLLEKLTRSKANDAELKKRLKSTQQTLSNKQKALSECGWRHTSSNSTIAQQCLKLSLSLKSDKQDQRMLNYLQVREKKARLEMEEKERANREAEWKARNQERVAMAESFYQQNRLNEARSQLNLVLKEDPNNKQAVDLMARLEIRLEGYLTNLLKAGDRLYRDGEIEGAKLTWQAAQNLAPDDARVKEKLERAERVLENLDSVRKQQ